jgi:hypothetical protein
MAFMEPPLVPYGILSVETITTSSLISKKVPHTTSDVTPHQGDVAIDLPLQSDEDNAVPGRVSFVPFNLVIGYSDSRPVWDVSLSVGDDGNVVIELDLEEVGLVGVGLTTTGG